MNLNFVQNLVGLRVNTSAVGRTTGVSLERGKNLDLKTLARLEKLDLQD